MMLTKTVAEGGNVEVTFRMPPLDEVVELFLCGDFNNWHTSGTPMISEEDGTWVATLVLAPGRSYRFRYYDNQGRWHNDWEADAYVPNDFGTEDSVVDLTAMAQDAPTPPVPKAPPKKKPATKKAAPMKRPRKTGR
jgi:1,4-alpha-glucan branching enzyme